MGPYTVSDGKFTYEYSVDGENRERQKDALKFLKDWATAFFILAADANIRHLLSFPASKRSGRSLGPRCAGRRRQIRSVG